MAALLKFIIVGLIASGVYIAMVAAHSAHELSLSTAFLVAAGVHTMNVDVLISVYMNCRRRAFERRLEASKDHVKTIVHEVIDRS